MYDRVLVININSYYSKVPITGTEYRCCGTFLVPYRYRGTFKKYHAHLWVADMFDKVAVSIMLRVTEDDRNIVALSLQQKKEIILNSLFAWGFFLYFRLALTAQKHFESTGCLLRCSKEATSLTLPYHSQTQVRCILGKWLFRLMNNYREFFFYITYCPIAT